MATKPKQSRAQRVLQKLMQLPHTVRALDLDPGWKFGQTKKSRSSPHQLHMFLHRDGHELQILTDHDHYDRISHIRGFVDGREHSSDSYSGWVRNGIPEVRRPDNMRKLLQHPDLLADPKHRKEPRRKQ